MRFWISSLVALALLLLGLPAQAVNTTFLSDPSEITLTADAAWTDADVSASCGAGTTGVALLITNTEAANNRIGLRKKGSTDNRTQFGDFSNRDAGYIGVDGSRIFQYFVDDHLTQHIYLVACFGDDASFLTNATDVSTGTTGSYQDVDISGISGCGTAIGAYVEHIDTVSLGDGWGLRKKGSTDAHESLNTAPRHGWAVIGTNGSAVFQQFAEATNDDLFVVGCQLKNATFNTNAGNDNLGSTGSYTDLTAVPAGSLGAIYEVTNSGTGANFGFRRNGSSFDVQQNSRASGNAWATVAVDSSGVAEGTIGNVAVDFWLIGYYSPAPPGGNSLLTMGCCN